MPLSNRRAGLAQAERARPLAEAQQAHAHAHRARGDEHDVATRSALRRNALDQVGNATGGELGILGRHDGGAELDHQTVGVAKRGAGFLFRVHAAHDFTLDALHVVMRV